MEANKIELVEVNRDIELSSIDYQAKRISALGSIKIQREGTFVTVKQHLLCDDEYIKSPAELIRIAKHFYERNKECLTFSYKALPPFLDKDKISTEWIKESAKKLKMDSRFVASLLGTSKGHIEKVFNGADKFNNSQNTILFYALKSILSAKKLESELYQERKKNI